MKTRETRLEDQKKLTPSKITTKSATNHRAVPTDSSAQSKARTPRRTTSTVRPALQTTRISSVRQKRANKENSGTGLPHYRRTTASALAKEEVAAQTTGKLADWTATMETEYDQLTSRLDSIKRESLRPAIKGDFTGPLPQSATRQILQPLSNEPSFANRLQSLNGDPKRGAVAEAHQLEQVQFAPAGQMEARSLAETARELFNDPDFAQLCEKGMKAQLQRTKDGATDKSRIAELAGLVKTLRRGLKEMTTKSTAFVDAGLAFEKEALAQVRAIQLANESASKQMEAELANAKRDAAQAAAAHKQAKASWHIELDLQRAEASHAKRELERMEAERDRAREEARRADGERAAIEGNVKGLKKEAGQQLRELQVDHGEAMRTLQEAQEAHLRREAELSEQLEDVQRCCDDAVARLSAAEAEAASLRQELWHRGEELAASTKAKEKLQGDCKTLAASLAEHEQLQREIVAQTCSSASEAAMLRQQCTALARQLAEQEELLQTATLDAAAMAEGNAAEISSLRAKVQIGEAELAGYAAQEPALQEEKCRLKAALNAALEQASQRNAELAAASAASAALQSQLEESRGRLEEARQAAQTAADQVQQVVAQLEETHQRLDDEIDARKALTAEASVKAARLARLEGEFEAMQEAIGTGSVDQAEMLGRLISRVASLEAAVAESHCARRELHNQLVNLRGNIRVFCRVKPHPKPALACLPDGFSVKAEVDGKEQVFQFDRVFGAASSQQVVFDEVAELVQSALDGFQVCLFSYGQTGAGKTHTMQGGSRPDAQGIIPRAVAKILEEAARLKDEGWEYELEASFVEVYNETLRDLLAEGKGRDVGKLLDANAIRHHPTGGPSQVTGAVRAQISTAQEVASLVKRAAAARAVEATAMNAVSSRSHSVFMLYICGHHAGSATNLLGGLNLVDLAGSERLNRSQVEGQRQKEACSINKSLSALGDVFSALAAHNPHVPYRNSKLTHLLQPCLGGDGKTLMFVNVNPEAESLQETVCSLRFAAKVNASQTAAKGGAKRHVSLAGDASARASLQGVKRQSVPAVGKRKAPAATAHRSARRKLG